MKAIIVVPLTTTFHLVVILGGISIGEGKALWNTNADMLVGRTWAIAILEIIGVVEKGWMVFYPGMVHPTILARSAIMMFHHQGTLMRGVLGMGVSIGRQNMHAPEHTPTTASVTEPNKKSPLLGPTAVRRVVSV